MNTKQVCHFMNPIIIGITVVSQKFYSPKLYYTYTCSVFQFNKIPIRQGKAQEIPEIPLR